MPMSEGAWSRAAGLRRKTRRVDETRRQRFLAAKNAKDAKSLHPALSGRIIGDYAQIAGWGGFDNTEAGRKADRLRDLAASR